MAYHGSTCTSFTLAGGSGNDVITDYVNPQLRKAQLRGNVNVVPVYACANTPNGGRPGFLEITFFSTFTCCEVSSFEKSGFQDYCSRPNI